MKFSTVLPFVAVSSALVLPTHDVEEFRIESSRRSPCLKNAVAEVEAVAEHTRDTAIQWSNEAADKTRSIWGDVKSTLNEKLETVAEEVDDFTADFYNTASDVEAWMSTKAEGLYDAFDDGHHGHHGDHDHKPNMTVYQLIAGSKYTTKLAAAINEFDDLVEALNSTKANFTVFAPTDKAFEKIPEGAPKPSKKQLKALLSYHVIPDFYPAKRVLFSSTAPTLLNSSSLGSGNDAQRMAFKLTLKGLTVNFYSRVIAVNVFGTNGVVHGLDSLLLPPAPAITEVDLFPGAFSTLELGLYKTGLLDMLNTTDHNGGTLFAPSNGAFEKLGPKANAFLFSKYGLKYLKALLEYHVVPENTLYSDAYYKESSDSVDVDAAGKIHVDLPTLLKDRSLSIDIGRYGPVIVINVNGFNRVAASDVVAEDGVIHVMSSVIVPPKKLVNNEYEQWTGGEITEEELIERLEPYVDHGFKLDL